MNFPLTPGTRLLWKAPVILAVVLSAAPAMTAQVTTAESPQPGNALTSQAPSAAAADPAGHSKKAGLVRIGIVAPSVEPAQGQPNSSMVEALRDLLKRYLTGPGTEVVPIAALDSTQISAEAQAKQCDYLVYDSFTYKKASSSSGMAFLTNARTFAALIPVVGGLASAAGAIATVASTAQQAAELTGAVTSKSEVVLGYHLISTGSPAPLLSNTATQKAKKDGDDILTPLVAQEASAILAVITPQPAK